MRRLPIILAMLCATELTTLADGWVVIGERDVTAETTRFDIGRTAGAFSHLTVQIANGTVEVADLAVQFGSGAPPNWHPPIDPHFAAGARTPELDLPGTNRTIDWVEIKLKAPLKGHPKVIVSGLRVGDANSADPAPSNPISVEKHAAWDPRGWTLLDEHGLLPAGESTRIAITRPGTFTQLTFVTEADLEVSNLAVEFVLGGPPGLSSWRSQPKRVFSKDHPAQTIDLPKHARAIKAFRFSYPPPTTGAKLQIWAR